MYSLLSLVHLSDELVDILLSVAKVTTLHVMLELPCSPSACGVREFEWPQEVGGLFEVGSSSGNFMDKIFDAKNIELSEGFFNNGIVCKGNALLIDFTKSTFVYQFTNRLQVGFTICDVGLNETEHLLSCPRSLDENAVIDLK